MNNYNIILEDNYETVVSEYQSKKLNSTSYQTEADLEKEFINILKSQAYEFLNIRSEKDLVANLRKQLEKLNKIEFTNNEWDLFFSTYIANKNDGIKEKAAKIQGNEYIYALKRDDGSVKNIFLIHKENNQNQSIANNSLQVINQYEISDNNFKNRYDVTILVNGLPLVHVELKKRGENLKQAFNQINRYQRDSFWMESGLFEYIQIFVISNGTYTKYYSNTTRYARTTNLKKYQSSSKSFEFTSFWSDSKNKNIPDLIDFAQTFFYKNTLLNILVKYCVFTSEKQLLVMRPYQITATEKIINKIRMSHNYKHFGTIKANGYIWHTTGSGKTLTSFKTAKLASQLDFISKVLFVVDRKDLDEQTMNEYNKYEKNAANTSKSTKKLQENLEKSSSRIIITTIQKLSNFINKINKHHIFNEKMVFIFDECHRTQFGEMHQKIKNKFKNSCFFGFTGTPIFNLEENAANTNKSTQDLFGAQLHTYIIIDAINDHNVLKFKVDYVKTFKMENEILDKQIKAINETQALIAPKRITNITKYIIDNFDAKTKRNINLESRSQKILEGFNSIFAVSSIEAAKLYYLEFQKQLKLKNKDLIVTTIFSYNPNEEEIDSFSFDEDFEANKLDFHSKQFLEMVVEDYNKRFNTNFSIYGDGFENFYKNVSKKTKNREIDILIVVNMFLTGFDAPTLNTLWVDKNLKMHGLIQAFSRTNRIFNRVKSFGQIICFRDLKENTDKALQIFGDVNVQNIAIIKTFEQFYYGYDEDNKHYWGYLEVFKKLMNDFAVENEIQGENNQKNFIQLFNQLLKLKNILSSFDEFQDAEKLSERDFQNYKSKYFKIKDELTKDNDDNNHENIIQDLNFEVELIQQDEINIDYILAQIQKGYYGKEQKISIEDIEKLIDSSMVLRSKKTLILEFIKKHNPENNPSYEWKEFIEKSKLAEVDQMILENNLKPEATKNYLENCYRNGMLKFYGTDLNSILPSVSRFNEDNSYTKIKSKVINILELFWNKYMK